MRRPFAIILAQATRSKTLIKRNRMDLFFKLINQLTKKLKQVSSTEVQSIGML